MVVSISEHGEQDLIIAKAPAVVSLNDDDPVVSKDIIAPPDKV